jgi:hypothetical protein
VGRTAIGRRIVDEHHARKVPTRHVQLTGNLPKLVEGSTAGHRSEDHRVRKPCQA